METLGGDRAVFQSFGGSIVGLQQFFSQRVPLMSSNSEVSAPAPIITNVQHLPANPAVTDEVWMTAAVDGNSYAVAQVELLSAPPRSVARLHHVDLERALAMVEVNRGMPIQVRVDLEQIEDPETLEAGRDVLLTHNQTAIVGALDAGRTLGGALRVISFERWLDDGPLGPLSGRRCVATERGEEILAWAPQGIADELRALVSRLEDDLRERTSADENPKLARDLEAEWKTASEGGRTAQPFAAWL